MRAGSREMIPPPMQSAYLVVLLEVINPKFKNATQLRCRGRDRPPQAKTLDCTCTPLSVIRSNWILDRLQTVTYQRRLVWASNTAFQWQAKNSPLVWSPRYSGTTCYTPDSKYWWRVPELPLFQHYSYFSKHFSTAGVEGLLCWLLLLIRDNHWPYYTTQHYFHKRKVRLWKIVYSTLFHYNSLEKIKQSYALVKVEAPIWLEICDCSYSETRITLTKNTHKNLK